MSETISVPFSEVETVRCPRCASGPDCKCWVMAGKGITGKTKVVPHLERVIHYFDTFDKAIRANHERSK